MFLRRANLSNMVYKKISIIILKISIIAIAWWYVVYKIINMPHDAFLVFNNPLFSVSVLVFVVLLMFVNWLIESYKWKRLAEKIQPISFFTSLQAVCIGMPLALVTPNRIGEIGGRSLVLQEHKKKTMLATFIGSIVQLITTLLFGIVGFILYIVFAQAQNTVSNAGYVAIASVIISIVLYKVLRNTVLIKKMGMRILGRRKYVSLVHTYAKYSRADILHVFVFSISRYVIFSGQFMLLAHMFLPEITFVQLCISVFLTYFFTTVIPTSVLGEVGIRGSVAMVVFGMFTTHEITIFQVSMLLWIINIVPPTLYGSYLLFRYRK